MKLKPLSFKGRCTEQRVSLGLEEIGKKMELGGYLREEEVLWAVLKGVGSRRTKS